jgi:hypothetical protein
MQRLEEFKRKNWDLWDWNWGAFSLAIPGRTGIQCRNFYVQLLDQNKIQELQVIRCIFSIFFFPLQQLYSVR